MLTIKPDFLQNLGCSSTLVALPQSVALPLAVHSHAR